MTRDEARLLLQAHRPGHRDDTPPLFAEALALMERDPELKAWWEAQQAFDQKISAKLREIPVPPELRERLLQRGKVIEFPQRYRLPQWFAAAAVVIILGVLATFLPPTAGEAPIARSDYNAKVLPYLGNDNPSLAMTSPDHGKLMTWLKERNAPMGALPSSMHTMPSVGCQMLDVQGHPVSLVCFTLANGQLVHLFVIDEKGLANPPPNNSPMFEQKGEWSTAQWSDGSRSYMLATRAGMEPLKQLL